MSSPFADAHGESWLQRTFRAFGKRNYCRFWLATFLSYTSSRMQMTLLAWLVLVLTESVWDVTLLGFFSTISVPVLGLTGGLLADRVDRHALQLLNVAVTLVLAWFLIIDTVQVWHIYLTVLITGFNWSLRHPACRALLYDLLGASGVTNAMALETMGANLSRMIGPALAGVLTTVVGAARGYTAVVLLHIASLILLGTMRIQKTHRRDVSRQAVWQNLAEGFQYVRQNRPILAVVYTTVVINLLLLPYAPVVPVITRDVLHVGPMLMGLLQAIDGLGALAGAMLLAAAARIRHPLKVLLAGAGLSLLALLGFSLSRWYWASLPAMLLLGLGTAIFVTMQSSVVMLSAKEEARGRALGIMSVAFGANPLGALWLGSVAKVTTLAVALNINAWVGLVGLVWITWWCLAPNQQK